PFRDGSVPDPPARRRHRHPEPLRPARRHPAPPPRAARAARDPRRRQRLHRRHPRRARPRLPRGEGAGAARQPRRPGPQPRRPRPRHALRGVQRRRLLVGPRRPRPGGRAVRRPPPARPHRRPHPGRPGRAAGPDERRPRTLAPRCRHRPPRHPGPGLPGLRCGGPPQRLPRSGRLPPAAVLRRRGDPARLRPGRPRLGRHPLRRRRRPPPPGPGAPRRPPGRAAPQRAPHRLAAPPRPVRAGPHPCPRRRRPTRRPRPARAARDAQPAARRAARPPPAAPARGAGRPSAGGDAGMTDPRTTVVVITHNRCRELLRTLGHLAALPERPRVIVTDNGSTDGTAEAVARRHPQVRLLRPGRNLGAVGRNLAVREVRTPYVAFCDDDSWWAPGSLAGAADLLDRHPGLGAVTARIVVEPDGTEDPIVRELRQPPVPGPPWLPGPALGSFLAAATVLRTDAFRTAGGFHPRLWLGGEEELLAADLAADGWWLTYADHLAIHHQASVARDPTLRRRHA